MTDHMTDQAKNYRGVHAVLYALFDAQERVDAGAMAAQVDYCVAQGCHGITVLGLATEVLKLGFDERAAMVATVGRALDGRLPFSVTVAGNSVAEQTALAVHFQVACRPDGWRAYVAGENGIVVREMADLLRQILRVNGFVARFGEIVQTLAGIAIVA